jgi:hypothetical protein
MMDEKEYKRQIRDLARMLYAYLKEHCVGRELSTSTLVGKAVKPESSFFPFEENEIWDTHDALWNLTRQGHKYQMDFDRYANQCVGLPYNIPFIFRLKKDKHECWDGLVPFFKSGKSYLKWIREGYHDECEGEYYSYFQELKNAVSPFGYDEPISEKEMCKALEQSQVSGEMIDVVPDPEFLPGGAREGQCDGWTYHLEFVSHEEYFRRHPKDENDDAERVELT